MASQGAKIARMTHDRSFPPFAVPATQDGAPRRTGIEVEFAGLSEAQVAGLVAKHLGGTVTDLGEMSFRVAGTRIGDVGIELDTALRKQEDLPLVKEGLGLMRGIVPVEIVTAPLTYDQVALFDGFCCDILRPAGALGTRDGVLLGFGVHLNPEIPGLSDPRCLAIPVAYALLEPWLRAQEDLDLTRRALPFVDPWPKPLVDALVAEPPATMDALMRVYAAHVQTRNHGLDLLPLLAHADSALFRSLFPQDAGGGRPTFHFRLPDCRIDEPDWSLSQAWSLWSAVEDLAADEDRRTPLADAWIQHRELWISKGSDWIERVGTVMDAGQPEGIA